MTIENPAIGGKLTVNTGAGNVEVSITGSSTTTRGTVGKDANIQTGDGQDGVWLENLTLGAKLTLENRSHRQHVHGKCIDQDGALS